MGQKKWRKMYLKGVNMVFLEKGYLISNFSLTGDVHVC